MTASGSDIGRSAASHVKAERVWLPSVLCGDDVSWTEQDSCHPHPWFTVRTDTQPLALTIDGYGRLKSIKPQRWGNPEGGEFHDANFGGVVEEEGTFGGYTVPTALHRGRGLYSSCRALRIHSPTIFGSTNSCKPFAIPSDSLSSNSLYLAERRSEARAIEASTGSAEARCPVISSM
jgi:hypothetical protein